jgi:CDP-diacylglycerol--glycerol-3-phosphate 3-phosphatidyltransferase
VANTITLVFLLGQAASMSDASRDQVQSSTQLTVTDRLRRLFRAPIQNIARGLIKIGIGPNTITFAGFLISIIPAVLAAQGRFTAAGIAYLLCTPLDALDGAVARESGKVSRFGAFLDSTLDRYTEAFLFGGIAYYMAQIGSSVGVILAFAALFGSVMVSYMRARSEGLTIDNKVGLMTRVERTVLTIIGLISGYVVIMLIVLAVLTQVTVIQRIWRVYHATQMDGS